MSVGWSRPSDAFLHRGDPGWLTAPALVGLILLHLGCYQSVPSAPDQAVRMLTDLLDDSHASVRRTAAEALGKIGSPKTEDALLRALSDSSPEVREAAARALGRLPSIEMRTARRLTALLSDSDASVRHAAAQALETADDVVGVVPGIVELLRDRRVDVRRSSGHALFVVGAPGTIADQALVEATHDPDASVRQWAIAALADSGAAASAPVIVERLGNDTSEAVRAEAAYRLRYLGGTVVEKELEASGAREKSEGVARWARHSVASLRTETGSGSAPRPSQPAETVHSRQYR
jgi:hypothetical protein